MITKPAFTISILAAAGLALAAGGAAFAQTLTADSTPPHFPVAASRSTAQPAPDLKAVLDAQVALGLKPIETLTPAQARRQPTLAQAAAQVLKAQGRSAATDAAVISKDLSYGGDPAYKVRLYLPVNAPRKPKPPLIVYFPDGGWVTGDLDAFDATPRLLATQLNAVVVSLEYRHSPEHGFGAAQADANYAYDWAMKLGAEQGADRGKVLIAGEGAGAALAVSTAIRNFEAAAKAHPKAVLLIDPMAGTGPATPSKALYAGARPLNAAMLDWYAHYVAPKDLADPNWDLTKADLRVLPHVVIVNAEIDPLRDDGAALEQALIAARVRVDRQVFPGMTHGFFGLGGLVRGAYDANQWALAAVRPDLDIHDADYHGGFGPKSGGK